MNGGELSAMYRVFGEVDLGNPSHHLRLAGHCLRVHTRDDRSARLIEDRFGHLVVEASDEMPQLNLRVSTVDLPRLKLEPGVHCLPGGGVATIDDGQQVQIYRPGFGFELGVSPAGWSDVELTSYPLATAIASWAVDSALLPVHAAALEIDGRGVLLVGESGAGKSTTAVACALEGAGLLGDDLCLIDAERRIIHSWYGTVKLHDDSAELLGARSWDRLGLNPMGKSVVAVSRIDALRLTPSAPLDLVVVLRPQKGIVESADAPEMGLSNELSGPRAVAALRSTALPVPNGVAAWLQHTTKIARTVRVVELAVDRPPRAMAEVIAAMADSASA